MDKKGLGKGIDALFSAPIPPAHNEEKGVVSPIAAPMSAGKAIVLLSVDKVVPNKRQPRQYFDEAKLQELSASIAEHGVAEPIIVRAIDGGKFELIAGERRLRASKMAGLKEIPAIIKSFSDEQALEIAIIENIQREDLSALEEAEAYKALMREFGMTQDVVSKRVGKSRSSVANTLRLLDLPEEIKESLLSGEISTSHARTLLSINGREEMINAWKDIVNNKRTVREVESLVSSNKKPASVKKALASELEDLQGVLSSLFGTKVKISGNTEKGKIEIHYFSREDIERVIELLAEDDA